MDTEQLARLRSRPWSEYGFVAAKVSGDIDALLVAYDAMVARVAELDQLVFAYESVRAPYAHPGG